MGIGNLYMMTSTERREQRLNISASLGLKTLSIDALCRDSPIAVHQERLRRHNIAYEGPEIEPARPWGVRHQFNIADTGYGMRGPASTTTAPKSEVGSIQPEDFDLERIFCRRGVEILHISGLLPPCRRRRGSILKARRGARLRNEDQL